MEKETATHSSILDWKIPGTEEPGGLQSMGLQRVGYHWATKHWVKHIDRYSWNLFDTIRPCFPGIFENFLMQGIFLKMPYVFYFHLKVHSLRDFFGSPVVKTPHFHCRGHGFSLWLGTKIPHVAQPKNKKIHSSGLCCTIKLMSGSFDWIPHFSLFHKPQSPTLLLVSGFFEVEW